MKSSYDLDSRSIEELWALHQTVVAELSRRIIAQHNALNVRLRQLGIQVGSELRLSRTHCETAQSQEAEIGLGRRAWRLVPLRSSAFQGQPRTILGDKADEVFWNCRFGRC